MNFIEQESRTKLRGGYYTDPEIARFLTRWVLEVSPQRVLEPSCGDGVFLRVLGQLGAGTVRSVTAFEIEDSEAEKSRLAAAGLPGVETQILARDFIEWGLMNINAPREFDAVLGNPPFIRYQYLKDEQQRLMQRVFEYFRLPFTKHTNLWVPFIVLALAHLRPGGRLAMVIPAELLHVLHAQSLRDFLVARCSKVLVVDPQELWFADALQGVILLMAEKKPANDDRAHGVAIASVSDRAFLDNAPGNLYRGAEFSNGDVLHGKWMRALLTRAERDLLKSLSANPSVSRFKEIAEVDVGIVTGANKFFLVTDEVVEKYGLQRWAHPMFGRSEHARGIVYDEPSHQENRRAGLPTNFLWFGNGRLEDFPPSVQEYLREGEAQGLPRRFKCGQRTPWYNVPSVSSAPVAMLKRAHDYPRLVLNRFNAYTTDTAYRIRPLGVEPEALVCSFVNSLTALTSELEGRHYGGGVLELVPSEIERLLVPLTAPPPGLLEQLDTDIRRGLAPEEILLGQDERLLGTLGLEADARATLHGAWLRLRARRQRTPHVPAPQRAAEAAFQGDSTISMKKGSRLPAGGA